VTDNHQPANPTIRKMPAMNSPYMTQTQRENVLAARAAAAGAPDRIRRALRLDNPHMWGERTGPIPLKSERDLIPTPHYTAGAQ